MNEANSTPDELLMQRAKRRVAQKMGFYTHATVYVVVNLGLLLLHTAQGNHGMDRLPLLGWGLGLAIHGLATFFSLQGDGLRERMIDSEVKRLRDSGR
ncbi:2TM domain-containing protein [Ideonella sp.]|uniref:2TM domain-containing protein n=1 Tax=Ideonella sp. TaxID=1929293 RepID=UPI003BB6B5AE